MSTKAGTIGVAGRPTGLVVWTGIVSALAAAALIMSAVALIQTRDQGSVVGEAASEQVGVASAQAPLWDAGKLDAMKGRVLAASAGTHGYVLWDDGKLAAMAGRVLATSADGHGYVLWDDGKIAAMHGRALAG